MVRHFSVSSLNTTKTKLCFNTYLSSFSRYSGSGSKKIAEKVTKAVTEESSTLAPKVGPISTPKGSSSASTSASSSSKVSSPNVGAGSKSNVSEKHPTKDIRYLSKQIEKDVVKDKASRENRDTMVKTKQESHAKSNLVSSSTSSASTSTSQSHVNFTDSNSQADSTQSSSHIQQDPLNTQNVDLTDSKLSSANVGAGLPRSKSDGDLPKAKSWGRAFLDRSFGLGSRTSGNNPLTPLGGNTQTTTQVTSANDPSVGKEVDTRDYVPGKGYTALDHSKSIVGTKSDGKPILESDVRNSFGEKISQHEGTHTNIIDNATGYGIGITTSSKKPNFIPLSNENFKGQLVSKDGPPKHQQIGLFDQPKSYESEALVKNKEATDYLKKHEILLDEIVEKHRVASAFNVPQRRVHKDSPTLYHENGQPIYDDNGNEIEY